MSSRAAQRAAGATPGAIVERFRDLLPRAVCSHPAFDESLAYLHGLDPDIASFCFYIEWNLRHGDIDLTFSFPTTLFGGMRIGFWDLARSLAGSRPELGDARHGRAVLEGVCGRLRTTPVDAPLFPRAVSFSVGSLAGSAGSPGVELVFLDFGPVLDLAADPSLLSRAFGLLAPDGERRPQQAAAGELERVAASLELAHVGAGWRRGRPLRKTYHRGQLAELVSAVVTRGAAPLIGRHVPDLERLARDAGPRTTHLVLDEVDGRLGRVGFELNFDVAGADGFPRLVAGDPLFRSAVSEELRDAAQKLAALGMVGRSLDAGAQARLRVSHLKLSFDGSGEPEWKAYLCFQRSRAD